MIQAPYIECKAFPEQYKCQYEQRRQNHRTAVRSFPQRNFSCACIFLWRRSLKNIFADFASAFPGKLDPREARLKPVPWSAVRKENSFFSPKDHSGVNRDIKLLEKEGHDRIWGHSEERKAAEKERHYI